MNQGRTRLDRYQNRWYKPGGSLPGRVLWYAVNELLFRSAIFPLSGVKCAILRLFGAKVGKGVVIKPRVNIKYPWNLQVGDYAWIGEGVWIDNLGPVRIGAHACLSQGCLLLCGNHNYKLPTFDLIVGNIVLEDGAWVGAMALIGPGSHLGSHAVVSAGSVATGTLDAYTVYSGNPARPIRSRNIETETP